MNEETMEAKARDEFLLKTRFPEECKRLPLEYLEPNEKIIAEKCINNEKLNEKELHELKQLLADYRPYMNKYDSIQVEQNLDENVRIIKSSRELLSLLNNPDRYRFDMHYKINGELVRFQFRIKPLSDNEYIDLLNVQTRIFRDLNNNEKLVYSKASNQMTLSPEEEKMLKNIENKIIEKIGDVDNNNDMITNFLINHVEFVDDESLTEIEQKSLWTSFDIGTRTLIYNKCKEILKVDEDLEVDLFPVIG